MMKKKVTFNPKILFYYIGKEEVDREARRCCMADRNRFQRRIKQSEVFLCPVLVRKLEEIYISSENQRHKSVAT